MLAYTGVTGTCRTLILVRVAIIWPRPIMELWILELYSKWLEILPNTGKELKHEVWVETSRLSGCNGVVNFA